MRSGLLLLGVAGLVGLACGTTSDDGGRALQANPGGVTACISPTCEGCSGCFDSCLCHTRMVDSCVVACGVQKPDECAAATGCFDTCVCSGGDAAYCQDMCTTGGGGTGGTGGDPGAGGTGPAGTAGVGGTGAGGSGPVTQPSCDNDGSQWNTQWQAWECEVLYLTNVRRGQGANCGGQPFGPAGPLEMQGNLRTSARAHSQDMGVQNFFDHTNPFTGTNPFQRMQAAGFQGGTMGENIAAGQSSPAQVVDGWMNSPGHCKNIMQPGFRYLGVGYFYAPASQYRHLWTQNFGG